MKKAKFLAVVAAAFALVALALVGCSSGSASGSAASAASSGSAESAAASAEASGSAAAADASASAASTDTAAATSLVVGFDAEYPPYGFMADDGSYTGFDLDLAKAVADANGWTFEAKPIDWDAKDVELDSGNISCIWNGFTMEGREGQYAFSEPYMINEQVIVVKADSGMTTAADLADKKVVTQAGSAALEVLTDGDQAELAKTFAGGAPQTIADYNNAFLQLDSGAVDAVACDLSIAAYQISQAGDKYVQFAEPLSSEHYAVGFKLGDEATAQAVTDTLKALYADGTVKQLCDKYAEYGLSFDNWVLK